MSKINVQVSKDLSKMKLLTIKQAATILKVSEKTLRRWEAKNYISPIRTNGQHRRYSLDQLKTVKKIKNQPVVIEGIIKTELFRPLTTATIPEPIKKLSIKNFLPKTFKFYLVFAILTFGGYAGFRLKMPTDPSVLSTQVSNQAVLAATSFQDAKFGINLPTIFSSTLTIGEDTFSDITGEGLTIVNGALTSTSPLGDDITSSEIVDNTISEVDFLSSNNPTSSQFLSFNSTTGGFIWSTPTDSVGSNYFTDSGDTVYLTTTSDDLAIGGSSSTAPFFFDVSSGNLSLDALTIGSIKLSDVGTSNITSGASLVGIYDEFSNSSSTTVQDVIDDLDSLLTTGASKFTQDTGFAYLTTTTDSLNIGGSTNLAKLAVDGDADEIQFLVQGNATQTADLAVFENSSGVNLLTLSNTAGLTLGANGTDGTLTLYSEQGATDYSTIFQTGTQTESITYTLPLDNGGADNYVLTTDGSGTLAWESVGGVGGMSSFSLSGDSGSDQTISDSNVLEITGGTNGIDTVASATDTVTLNIDTTEIGENTWSNNTDPSIVWTFDQSGTTDPTLAFSSDLVTVGGDLAISGGNITTGVTFDSTVTTTGTTTLNGATTVNDDFSVALTGNENVEITDGTTPTTDTLSIVSNGATITNDANALEIDFTTGDGASVTNSGLQIDLASGGTASGDIIYGINLTMDANDSSTQTAINIGANFDTGVAFGDVTREIVLENGEAIIGQTADTITFEDDDGTDYATLTGTALTVTGDLAITGGNITTAVTFDGRLETVAHANNTGLNLPTNAGAPVAVTGTAEGDMVYDTTGNSLYIYDGGSFTAIGGGGYSGWTIDGDDADTEAISSGNTLLVSGGTNGIDTDVSATDTITLNLDTTEVGTTTFGSGSGITWTFDTSAGTDTTVAFGNNTQTFTTGTATFSGNVAVNGASLTVGSAGTDGALTLYSEMGVTDYSVILQPSNSQSQDTTYTLPIAYAGGNDYVLTSSTAGVMSWQQVTAVGGAGDITAVGNITSSEAFTSGTPGTSLYFATGGDINDANGNEVLTFTTTTSAVNELTLANAAANGNITLTATGSDTDIDIETLLKGTGTALFSSTTANTDRVAIKPQTSTATNTFTGSLTTVDLTADRTYTLKDADGTLAFTSDIPTSDNYQYWTIDGDDATTEQIGSTNTLLVAGGTNGIDTDVSATDTITLNFDTTEVGTATFGSGSAVVWTFDASVGTDPTLTFGDSLITVSNGLTVTGTTTTNGIVNLGDGGDLISIAGSDTNVAVLDGSSINIDGDTSPTADLLVLGASDITATDQVDALSILFSAADGTNLTNSAINISLTSLGTATGDLMRGLFVDLASVANAASTNKAIEIENTTAWDTDIELQNDETIDNVTDGRITIGATTLAIDSSVANADNFVISPNNAGTGVMFTGTLTSANLTADRTWTLQDGDGTVAFLTDIPTSDNYQYWTIDGDDATTEQIGSTNTLLVAGGTNGIDTDVSATDTITLNFDTTEVGTATFGSGSAVVWTFDASVGTDPTLTFGDSLITVSNGLTVTGTTILNGLTTVNDDFTVALTGNENVEITDGATPTTDTLSIVANGATVTADANGIEIDFTTGDGTDVTNSGLQIDLASGGTAATDIINAINLSMDAADASSQRGVNFSDNNYDIDINATTDLTLGIGNTSEITLTGTNLAPSTAEGNSLGSATLEWEEVFVGDDAGVKFGLDQDWSLLYDEVTDDRLELTTAGTTGVLIQSATATGTELNLVANSISTGTILQTESTSTALTTAGDAFLGYFNWNPGSATTASGDLFRINIGSSGNVTNVFNITDNGSSLFRVSETQIESAIPHSFTAAGDVNIAYDLVFTNQTASVIDSYGPLTLRAGESFESNNLTLTSYLSGNILLNTGATAGKVGVGAGITPLGLLTVDSTGTGAIGKAALTVIQDESQDIITASASATTRFTVNSAGNTFVTLRNTATSAVCHVTNGAGYDELTDCLTSVSADYAEMYPVANDITYGEIVMTGNNDVQTTTGETIKQLVKSNAPYQNNVLGITSDNHGDFTSTGNNIDPNDNPMPVALSGRVPVKVSASSESIHSGDFITSSNEQGKAMKAITAGKVIGTALEDWIPNSDKDTVMVFVNNFYYTPAPENQVTLAEIESLLRITEQNQQLLNESATWNTNTATSSAEFTELITENLFVTGLAAFDSLSLTNSLTLGNNLVITDGNIDSITAPLNLQGSAAQPLNFMAGKVSIDTSGNMIINGDLKVLGTVTAEKVNVSQAVAGTASILAGTNEITLLNENIKTGALIFVTPTSPTKNSIYVKSQSEGQVTIGFDEPETPTSANIKFNWWIVGVTQ